MNPIYRNVHFQAELPYGALPAHFGIMTAWNPAGIPTEAVANETANQALQAELTASGFVHFPVTGGSADQTYQETGFGVIASEAKCLTLARTYGQEAIYTVNRGQVKLVSCGTEAPELLATWREMALDAAAHPTFHFLGNLTLLTQAPLPIPKEAHLAKAWASAQAKAKAAPTVISGFDSPVAQDVFQRLCHGRANLIWVPARDLPKIIPSVYQELLSQNRLLIASPFDYQSPSRPTKESGRKRDQWVDDFLAR